MPASFQAWPSDLQTTASSTLLLPVGMQVTEACFFNREHVCHLVVFAVDKSKRVSWTRYVVRIRRQWMHTFWKASSRKNKGVDGKITLKRVLGKQVMRKRDNWLRTSFDIICIETLGSAAEKCVS
jgi:hypothetical protein